MRSKYLPIVILAVVPMIVAMVGVFGLTNDSPYIYSNFLLSSGDQILPGRASIENTGSMSFGSGRRAALDVFAGKLPLWDHYQGLGAPLLGALPGAALFPPTWLLIFNHGQLIEHPLLQFIGGLGAYLFFRRFGLSATAALTGGLLFEVNGVFAWLRNAIFNPVAFLPWLLLTVESLRAAATEDSSWRVGVPIISLGAVAGALAIYAGFPEVTYLYAILVAAWTIFRMWSLSRTQNLRFARDLVLTSVLALALCSPVLVSFIDFLPEAFSGAHEGAGFYGQTLFGRSFIQHFLPYVYGPVWASFDPLIISVWGGMGGYIGLAPAIMGIAALFLPARRGVKIFLAVSIVIGLGVTFGLPGVYQLFMLLPLTKLAACYRYLNTAWIFCFVFLSALFLDEFPVASVAARRFAIPGAVAIAALALAIGTIFAWPLLSVLWHTAQLFRWFAIGSLICSCAISAALLASARWAKAAFAMSAIIVFEAVVCFALPFLSYPRHVALDRPAIAFLQTNLGLQRMMGSVGARAYGLVPQYNSAFGISSLNYDNIPSPARTMSYIQTHLDHYAAAVFLPWEPERTAERAHLAVERLAAYARAGVKYVLAGPEYEAKLPVVYEDPLVTIYELPGVRDYFSADRCKLTPDGHDSVQASCEAASRLTRLEAHMSGWTATVNGREVPISLEDDTFEVIDVPAGTSEVNFSFSPPGFKAAVAACVVALIMVMLGGYSGWGRRKSALLEKGLK